MAAPQKKPPAQNTTTINHKTSMIKVIKERQTDEIVIALCGSIGSGTSTIASKISEIFDEYGYAVEIIKISDIIIRHYELIKTTLKSDNFLNNIYSPKIDLDKNIEEHDTADRIALLQSAGNALRKKETDDILAQLAINEIALARDEEERKAANGPQQERTSRRRVTIIDSLKNPNEVELLQLVYKDMFYLFGVLCPEDTRQNRLEIRKDIAKATATLLISRDKSEGEKSGQQMLNTIWHSEFFITNTHENIDRLKPNLKRYVKLMMGDSSITPTLEENSMFHAHSASVKSGCLSRQVGAAIVDESGNLLSTGCNDVPKYGGGLYSTEDGENDSRCMFKYGGKCQNQDSKNKIFAEIEKILKENIKKEDTKKYKSLITTINTKIKELPKLKGLIEYCRAIHAEMDAITSIARNGSIALKGTSLFCTTFPCHNCAKHIIAAGITKVYYIEPYEKSLALSLHSDAISYDRTNTSNSRDKVEFIPFEGVSPNKYLKLFFSDKRKYKGARILHNKTTASPIIPVLLETRYEYEAKVVAHLDNIGLIDKNSDGIE